MEFPREVIALWKNFSLNTTCTENAICTLLSMEANAPGAFSSQYIGMIKIQLPEIFRSAAILFNAVVSYLTASQANRFISIPRLPEKQQNKDVVECEVLYCPPPEMHQTDIIIVHGLHGSTYKTWRQGLYNYNEIKKVRLRKNIPLSDDVEPDDSMCKKCNLTKRKSESDVEPKNGPKMARMENDDAVIYESYTDYNTPSDGISSTYNYHKSTSLSVDGDNIYYDNINLFSKTFKSSNNNNVEVEKGFIQMESSKSLISDDLCGDYCDCNYNSSNSIDYSISQDSLGNTYDSNITIRGEYPSVCPNCKRKRRNMLYAGMRRNSQNCYISYEFESISGGDDDFYHDCKTLDAENYKRGDNISVDFYDDFEDGGFMDSVNGPIEQNYCNCNEVAADGYLEYADIYGNGPALLKNLFFVVKFMFSFAKEAYSLYKKLWQYSQNTEQLSACWPRDWLPEDCPNARVISVNYTTFLWTPIWIKNCNRTSLQEKSLEMAKQLEDLGVGKRPIVWVAHSKGGLFVKQMYINSRSKNGGVSKELFNKTDTIVFYSVPQHGSILAYFFMSPFVTPSIEIMEMRTGSKMLKKLQSEFQEALQVSKNDKATIRVPTIVSYTETIPTNMSGVLLQIVFPTSADPGVGELYGIPLDHRMICKFASKESVLYKDLVELIQNTTSR